MTQLAFRIAESGEPADARSRRLVRRSRIGEALAETAIKAVALLSSSETGFACAASERAQRAHWHL